MLALGALGWVQRAMQAVPMPIVMGMVAGVFLQFGLDWVRAFQADLAIAAAMTAAFLRVSAVPPLAARLPPLIVGAGRRRRRDRTMPARSRRASSRSGVLAAPRLHVPEFSWAAMVELVVPLAITRAGGAERPGHRRADRRGPRAARRQHRGRLRRRHHRRAPSSAPCRPA